MATTDDVIQQIEERLSVLTDTDTQLARLTAERDLRLKAISDKYAPMVDPLTKKRGQLVNEITALFQDIRPVLESSKMKTAVFRSGTLSARFTPGKVVIDDETTAMAYTRKHGMLRKVTKLGKRTFVKDELKKYPDFVEKAPGMHIDRPENLIIKLAKTQIEIIRELTPFTKRLN